MRARVVRGGGEGLCTDGAAYVLHPFSQRSKMLGLAQRPATPHTRHQPPGDSADAQTGPARRHRWAPRDSTTPKTLLVMERARDSPQAVPVLTQRTPCGACMRSKQLCRLGAKIVVPLSLPPVRAATPVRNRRAATVK